MKIKILQVLPELNTGEIELDTVELAKFLVQSGHGSYVLSNGGTMITLERMNRSRILGIFEYYPPHVKLIIYIDFERKSNRIDFQISFFLDARWPFLKDQFPSSLHVQIIRFP